MIKRSVLSLALLAAAGLGAASSSLEFASRSLLARRALDELSSANAKRSIRGAKSLWIELSLPKSTDPAFGNLEADLRSTEMEGQLRKAGFRLMDPKKRSLAISLKPTLILSVYYTAKGGEGNDMDFYLVTAKATQDVTPLGGDKLSMTTWLVAGEPIASSGRIHTDIDAIRASARACVRAFIDTAQDNDVTPAAPAQP